MTSPRGVLLPLLLAGGLVGVALFNFVGVQGLQGVVREAEPSRVDLLLLVDPGCPDCLNLSPLLSALYGAPGIQVDRNRWVEASTPEGRSLAEAHNLTRAPALVATGEVARSRQVWESAGGSLHNGAAIVEPPGHPHVDLSTARVVGRVSAVVLEAPGCPDCADPRVILPQIARFGANASSRTVGGDSPEGLALRERYRIQKLPGLVLSPEASLYPGLAEGWRGVGGAEADGSLVLRANAPPYLDLDTGKVVGRVSKIVLNDSSCRDCTDVSRLEGAIARLGMAYGDTRRLDVAQPEGSALVRRYNITRVPTVLLSPEAGLYPQAAQVWPRIGTVEGDGWRVFRAMEALSPRPAYRNLTTGEVVWP